MRLSTPLHRISLAVISLVLTLTLVGASPTRQAAPAGAPAAITVAIASPEHFGRRVLAIDQGILVVVTNVSAAPVRVWRDWCSWGFQQLSFEITDDAGHSWTVSRKDHPFFKNYPDYWTLGPGEPLVLNIALTTDLWESPEAAGALPIADLKGKAVTMRAIFAASADDQSRENNVWTGRVTSTPRTYEVQ